MSHVLQRLVANAEEVAFNDPPGGAAERLILNSHLQRLLRHARLSALQRFFQQVALVLLRCSTPEASLCHAATARVLIHPLL